MSASPSAAARPLLNEGAYADSVGNRFLLSAIAFQRSKQLSGGAAARIPRDGHKPTHIAVLEVLANTISWSRE
jgi:DNA-directed RNA polymerase subunit K/omega